MYGLFEVKSLGGNNYFVSFIDEFTIKNWIYLINKKSEVFEILKKFQLLAEKQIRKVIKMFRTNRGGEYNTHKFQKFYGEEGIVYEVTYHYTPEHNGVGERRNRRILNMAKSMMKRKEMSLFLG